MMEMNLKTFLSLHTVLLCGCSDVVELFTVESFSSLEIGCYFKIFRIAVNHKPILVKII